MPVGLILKNSMILSYNQYYTQCTSVSPHRMRKLESQPSRPYQSTKAALRTVTCDRVQTQEQMPNPPMPEPTNQFLQSVMSRDEGSNTSIVQAFKGFDNNCRNKLQQFCLDRFDNLPLFLMYELGWELGLHDLSQACSLELINENYEQLNYSKFDLMKCSFFTFRKILDEYSSLVKSLEIQGLKQSNLKSVIDDYCSMCQVDSKDRENLYNQFVYTKETFLGKKQREVRRSMIETSKTKEELSNSLKLKNSEVIKAGPTIKESECRDEKPRNPRLDPTRMSLDESARIVKLQIEEDREKEALLFSQIVETRQAYSDRWRNNFLKESFEKLQKSLQSMQKEIKAQNQKLQKIQKSASDIKAGSANPKKIDFVFSF